MSWMKCDHGGQLGREDIPRVLPDLGPDHSPPSPRFTHAPQIVSSQSAPRRGEGSASSCTTSLTPAGTPPRSTGVTPDHVPRLRVGGGMGAQKHVDNSSEQ